MKRKSPVFLSFSYLPSRLFYLADDRVCLVPGYCCREDLFFERMLRNPVISSCSVEF